MAFLYRCRRGLSVHLFPKTWANPGPRREEEASENWGNPKISHETGRVCGVRGEWRLVHDNT